MRQLLRKISRFIRSDAGPTAVEYAVMLALMVIICLAAVKALGTNTSTTFSNAGSSVGG